MPYHGFRVEEARTSVPTPAAVPSGIPFAAGTSPVQSVGAAGKVNVAVMANTFEEAAAALGYSDDWKKYTLCEFFYAHFKLFEMGPVVLVNVLDPAAATMKEAVGAADMAVADHQVKLSIDAINSASLVVKAEEGAGAAYVKGTDYEVFYDGEYCVVELLSGGGHYADTSLNIAYERIKISGVTAAEIVGGYDVGTHKTTGIECVTQVMAQYGIVPDILLAPGWSHEATVAAALNAKAAGIHSLFKCKDIVDIPATTPTYDHFSEAVTAKTTAGLTDKNHIIGWPLGRYEGKIYHMSTLIAGLIATVDYANSCPYESPSNKALPIDSIVVDNGSGTFGEVILSIDDANVLNEAGIVTAIRMLDGFTLWGNYTAAYTPSADIKDVYIPVTRMFDWVGKTVIRTHWSKLDRPFTPLVAESIVNATNLWLDGLTGEGKLLGGRIEYKPEENTTADLLAGRAKWHIYLAPPLPGQEFHFVLEYDISYLTAAFAAA